MSDAEGFPSETAANWMLISIMMMMVDLVRSEGERQGQDKTRKEKKKD